MRFHYLLLVFVALTLPVRATLIDLNFEGLEDTEAVLNYYSGDTGSLGSGPGTNYGVTFSPDATAFIQSDQSSGDVTDTGNFGGEPSPYTAILFCGACQNANDTATIDVSGGFGDTLSLYYSAPDAYNVADGTVSIFSGLDGSGTLLGALTLAPTATGDATGDGECDEYGNASNPGAPFCPFVQLSTSFSGTAQSIVFTGASYTMAFDDISFDGPPSPEPSTWLLLGVGLIGIAFCRRLQSVRRSIAVLTFPRAN